MSGRPFNGSFGMSNNGQVSPQIDASNGHNNEQQGVNKLEPTIKPPLNIKTENNILPPHVPGSNGAASPPPNSASSSSAAAAASSLLQSQANPTQNLNSFIPQLAFGNLYIQSKFFDNFFEIVFSFISKR